MLLTLVVVTLIKMSSDFPVDCGNLSFSDNDNDAASLFITQSTFKDVSTQDVNDATDYIEGLGNVTLSEISGNEDKDIQKLAKELQAAEHQDAMCSHIFDFSNDVDNGYIVSTHDDPIIVTRKSDGKKIVVPKSGDSCDKSLAKVESISNFDVELDIQCFKSIVSDEDLDGMELKR